MTDITPNLVTWSGMITGYAEIRYGNEALKIFREIQLVGMNPNSIIIVSMLQACARVSALQLGKKIRNYILKSGHQLDILVGNSLTDMYGKCGSIDDACHVFDRIPWKDLITWNALIAGFAMHGHGEYALILFYNLQKEYIKPNDHTFIVVSSACNHAGLVEDGLKCFECMV
jgi:pentatricopeptide repeat protein